MSALKIIYEKMEGIRKYFLAAILFVVIESLFEVIIPLLMSDIIDVGIAQKDTSLFLEKGIEMFICAIFSLLFGYLYARYASIANSKLAWRLRNDLFESIQAFSFENLDHFEVSSLVTRITSDVNVIQSSITTGIRPIVRGPSMLVLGISMSFIINAKLAIVFFIMLPILGILLFMIVKKVAPMYSTLQSAIDKVNKVIQENLNAIRVVKAFVREDHEEMKFDQVNSELSDISWQTFHYALMNRPALQFTMYAAIVCMCIIGGKLIYVGEIKVGELTGVLSYVLQVMNSLIMVSNVFLLITRSLASVNRIKAVFDEIPSLENGTCQQMDDYDIEFENVSFKYALSAKEDVLANINLKIPSGTKLGILGGTGSAKSSLVQLIPRLYDVTSGEILIGGKNVKEYDLKYLRDKVGMVLQKNVLFSGSVIDNLKWGNTDADDEDIKWACSVACVDEFIDRLQKGLETDLGQGGVNVSGGQKQRLCIARALLKKPHILIFDDSTSAVDVKTDAKIRNGLATIKGLTQIIIAQRISSVIDCDQILILDDGHVDDIGTHAELLERNAIYQELYRSQNKGSEAYE